MDQHIAEDTPERGSGGADDQDVFTLTAEVVEYVDPFQEEPVAEEEAPAEVEETAPLPDPEDALVMGPDIVAENPVTPGQLFYFGGDDETVREYLSDQGTAEYVAQTLATGADITVYFSGG